MAERTGSLALRILWSYVVLFAWWDLHMHSTGSENEWIRLKLRRGTCCGLRKEVHCSMFLSRAKGWCCRSVHVSPATT
ncbi:uncharacterized protein CC84DRAFT_497386 [Paraphaeosphaeria sporulosa]|uniref:Uncharacterized protein n=1 Tax=Paraphaeosphaeria sporulosa TaxID=1460663 RepID=A0A177CTP9_9PLEO|nr:uncharacterized protein CC84DRAFT_497386 [Paraphaeosphaeria sporulosa]OAG10903.1 hypothetical protein CC84DRAFT_497386 [Paraphaeosphaeria sporulosa]